MPPRLAGPLALLAALSLTACASTERPAPEPAPPPTPLAAEAPAGAVPMIGEGAHHYQPVLRDGDGKVMAQTPFALSLQNGDLPFVQEEKKVWRGVTDAEGRTPVFALPFAVKAEDIFLRPRMGDGPMGQQMRVVDDAGAPLANIPYRLVLCSDPPQQYLGVSDDRGYTAYSASTGAQRLLLFATFAKFAMGDEPEAPAVDPAVQQLEENRQACGKAAAEPKPAP